MKNKPQHTCFQECAGCAFELGTQLAKEKNQQSAKYVWMVEGSDNPCDIRRYAFSHKEGIAQLSHLKKNSAYKDASGVWRLFKLVPVNKKILKDKETINR